MKKLFAVLMAAAMLLALCACGNAAAPSAAPAEKKTFIMSIFMGNSALKPGS